MLCLPLYADNTPENDTTAYIKGERLSEVIVSTRRSGMRKMSGAMNGNIISRDELFKAACCNLGESFVTNPSVDVNYSDATTGAKQIRLLGLSGTYVQMLTENLPNLRGVAAPYALGYVPGTWMKSIQVSKGSSSVKNGYESITGQINIEYLKPEDEEGVSVNLYGNTQSRFEANADANIHISKGLSAGILTHFENNGKRHDSNGDGFMDEPNVRQYNLQNRWHFVSGNYIMHAGMGFLKEKREGGQIGSGRGADADMALYRIGIETDRYEAYMKHAFIIDPSSGTNIALMSSASMHRQDAMYGNKSYDVNEKNLYASLVFETNFTKAHNLSAGLSLNHDYSGQRLNGVRFYEKETVPGGYVQYTYNLENKLTAMAGLRVDNSSMHGTFVTPRFHLKYAPNETVTFRASAGKGYRTVHALAENNYLLASGRELIIDDIKQESAWNYGLSSSLHIPISNKTLKVNAEYYYTRFGEQAVIDYDTDVYKIRISNLSGKSYSHTFQIDASYPVFKGFELTAAYRYNDVKTTYGGQLMSKPLTSKYKGLLTASYKTPLGLWQFDATLQLNGSGRMPKPYETVGGGMSWDAKFGGYGQLSAQITRYFRRFSIYIGGENLTGFKQKRPVIGYANPYDRSFEPTLVWGPVHGAVAYIGTRIDIR